MRVKKVETKSTSVFIKENAESDRDDVYDIIMNYEYLYKEAMRLSQGVSPKMAIRNLYKFVKEVGLDQVPKIRLSDKGALLVAARILNDSK